MEVLYSVDCLLVHTKRNDLLVGPKGSGQRVEVCSQKDDPKIQDCTERADHHVKLHGGEEEDELSFQSRKFYGLCKVRSSLMRNVTDYLSNWQ